MTLTADTIFKKNPAFIPRKIAGEIVLVPLQRQIQNIKSIYHMNAVASVIWDLIDGKRTWHEIRSELLEQFEVEEAALDQDLGTLISQLKEIDAIQTA